MLLQTKFRTEAVTGISFIFGLLLFLNSVHSVGEAFETLKFSVSFNGLSIIGGLLMITALMTLIVLLVSGRKTK